MKNEQNSPLKATRNAVSPDKKQKAWHYAERLAMLAFVLSLVALAIFVGLDLIGPLWILPATMFIGWLIIALVSAQINKVEPDYNSDEDWHLWSQGL